MKIGSPDAITPAATPATGTAAAAKPAAAPHAEAGAAKPESSTHVQLSDAASVQDKSASTADFDAEKVKRISDQMANGTFKVDAGAIADKLISNAQELLGKVSK